MKEGDKVKVAERYLNDEVNENSDVTPTAIVQYEPKDDEELICIQYMNGLIDHVPRDILEVKESPKYRLFAEAPTVYQSNSVRAFGLDSVGRDGLMTAEYFATEEEAKERLHEIINYWSTREFTEEELDKMREDVDNGYLTYDAVTCHLQESTYHSDDVEDVTWT